MDNGFKFFIESWSADSVEDSFHDGEIVGGKMSWWDSSLFSPPPKDGFETVKDALRFVCEQNSFGFNADNWEEDYCMSNVFWGDFLVDDENNEILKDKDPKIYEDWKSGKMNLFNCRLTVKLTAKKIEEREITYDDILGWNGV